MLKSAFKHLIVFLGATIAVQASVALVSSNSATAVHLISPVYGLAIGVVLSAGWRYLPAILIGTFLSSRFGGDPFVYTASLTLAVAVAAVLSRVLVGVFRSDLRMERIADAATIIVVIIAVAPLAAALFETGGLILNQQEQEAGWAWYRNSLPSVWLASAMGSLVLAPFMLAWSKRVRWGITTRQGFEIFGWLILLVLFGRVTFQNWAPTDTLLYPMELAIFPIMAWAAIRFGLRGVTAGIVAISIIAYWELMLVLGPENKYISQSPSNMWIFVGILGLTSIALAAVMAELKYRELRIAENESRLRAFTDALPDMAFVLSRNGEIFDVFASSAINMANHRITAEDASCGRSLEDIFEEPFLRRFEDVIHAALDSGSLQTLEYALDSGLEESPVHWFDARIMPMERTGDGVERVVWVAYDITLRKESEAALEQRDEILGTTAQAKNLLLTTMDFEEAMEGAMRLIGSALKADRSFIFEIGEAEGGNFRTVSCNLEWRKSGGIPSFKQNTLYQDARLDALFPDWYQHFVNNGVIQGTPSQLSEAVAGHLSEMKTRSLLAVPVWVDRSLWGFFGVDVCSGSRVWEGSEVNALHVMSSSMSGLILIREREDELRRERDRADAASMAKGEFLAMMSHEIRTPMNAIIGYSDILSQSDLTENQSEQVSIVKRSGRALLELINNILDYSKIESSSLQLEMTKFNLEQVVCEAMENVLVRAKEKELDFDFDIGKTLATSYMGDPHRLRQILINLLNNAVKFTSKGSVRLQVERVLEASSEGIDELHFQVIDTGMGIPEEKFDKLFRAFSQVDSSTTRQFGGTGLGLAIAKRLVERMDGRIWVESVVGKGTTFHFTIRSYLPAAGGEVTHPGVPVNEDEIDPGFARRYPLHLLFCEDDRDNQWVVREILESLGYDVEIVGDGREATHKIRNGNYDVVLMDVQIPEIDGLEVTRMVRRGELGKDKKGQYILAITAFAMKEDRKRCIEAGMNDYLSKPIVLARLKDALRLAHETVHAGVSGKAAGGT